MTIETQDGAEATESTTEAPKKSPTDLALVKVQQNLAEFDAVEAGLADLEKKYKDVVYDVSTPKGLAEAKAARAAIREPRYAVQNAVSEAKRPLEAMKKALAARGEAIIERIMPLETPIDTQVKNREKEIEDEKLAEAQRAAAAALVIDTAIQSIHDAMANAIGQPVTVIDEMQTLVEAIEVTLDTFGDRTGEAEQAKTRALEAFKNMREQRLAFDAQQLDLERQQEEQRQREEEAERNRQAQQQKDEQEAKDRKAKQDKEDQDRRDRLDAEERELSARRAAQDKEDAERRNMHLELEGMQHQIVIARAGRAPYFEGNRADEMPRLIEQTEGFNFDHFPESMRNVALSMKEATLTTLRAIHQEFIERDDRLNREAQDRANRTLWKERIDDIRRIPALCRTVAEIDEGIERISAVLFNEENFGTLVAEAEEMKAEALAKLNEARPATLEREEKARQAELDRQAEEMRLEKQQAHERAVQQRAPDMLALLRLVAAQVETLPEPVMVMLPTNMADALQQVCDMVRAFKE